MIFVMLGTQDKQFKRLIDVVLQANLDDEIIIQKGYTKFESDEIKNFKYCSKNEYEELISKADIVITHGGVGSIMTALSKNKKVIAMARLAKYGEHQNDHQLDIIDNFAIENYIFKLDEKDDLKQLVQKIKSHQFKKVSSNNEKFIENLLKYLEL